MHAMIQAFLQVSNDDTLWPIGHDPHGIVHVQCYCRAAGRRLTCREPAEEWRSAIRFFTCLELKEGFTSADIPDRV